MDLVKVKGRKVVHVACLTCGRLRIKVCCWTGSKRYLSSANERQCDGRKPVCTPCIERSETCEYDVEANSLRTNALERKNETLESEVDQFKELFRFVREQPQYEASEVFRRIRATEDPFNCLKNLKAPNALTDGVGNVGLCTSDESKSDSGREEDDSETKSAMEIKYPRGRHVLTNVALPIADNVTSGESSQGIRHESLDFGTGPGNDPGDSSGDFTQDDGVFLLSPPQSIIDFTPTLQEQISGPCYTTALQEGALSPPERSES